MLSSLLGQGKLDALSGAISKFAGLNQGSTGSLLGALAPVVMGTLAREQRAEGLDAQGLARMLSDQKDHIVQALPANLASSLGSAGLLEGIADRLGQGVSAASQAGRATAAEAARAANVAATAAATRAGSAASTAPQRRLDGGLGGRRGGRAGRPVGGLSFPVSRRAGAAGGR
jgi:Bacterial protein of unknown function (DUF937)